MLRTVTGRLLGTRAVAGCEEEEMKGSAPRKFMLVLTLGLLAGCTLPFGGGSSGSSNNNNGSSTTVNVGPGVKADKTLGTEIWHNGFHVTLVDVTYKPPEKASPSGFKYNTSEVIINAKFENLGPDTTHFYSELAVASNGQSYTSRGDSEKLPNVPGKAATNGVIALVTDEKFNLDDAVLTIGNAAGNQAVAPLGSKGKLVDLKPRQLTVTGSITLPDEATLTFTGATLSYDNPASHREEDKDNQLLTLKFSVLGTGTSSCCLNRDTYSLKIPDGTAIAADSEDSAVPTKGTTKADQNVEFIIKSPVEGDYDLIVKGKTEGVTGDLKFTITAAGSASGGGSTTTQPSATASGAGH
jgi:hypothetical protein